MIPACIFPATLKKLIPLQLLQSFLSPLPLCSGTIRADIQSFGTNPLSKAILHSLQIQSTTLSPPTFYHLSCDLILTCSLSILKLSHSYLNLILLIGSHPKQLPLRTLSMPHMWNTICIYIIQYLYYTDPHNTPSKSFAFQPLPVPTSHFHTLFCWNTPPSRIISYFHSQLESCSFQTALGPPFYFKDAPLTFFFSSLQTSKHL